MNQTAKKTNKYKAQQ